MLVLIDWREALLFVVTPHFLQCGALPPSTLCRTMGVTKIIQ